MDTGCGRRLEGVDDRDAAELLRGADIEVERSALPPTAAREYYRDDLSGYGAHRRGRGAGIACSHFVDAPAAPVMVVKGEHEYVDAGGAGALAARGPGVGRD